MSAAYSDRAGGGEAARGLSDNRPPGSLPPPALTVGQPVAVHTASCESPEQHQRVTLAGRVVERYDDGAALAEMADGQRFELCPWFTSDCPNERASVREAAA
jgi:hypothetical protein